MKGCIYKIGDQIKAYTNMDRFLKKNPNVEILKVVDDISQLDNHLKIYLGEQVTIKPKNDYDIFNDRTRWRYLTHLKPVIHVELIPKSRDISNIKIEEGCILTDDYNEYVKWWDKTIKLI